MLLREGVRGGNDGIQFYYFNYLHKISEENGIRLSIKSW